MKLDQLRALAAVADTGSMQEASRRGHPLAGARSVRELLDADWLTLDPLADAQSPFHALFAASGLAAPARVIECASMSRAFELCWRSETLVPLSGESRRRPFRSPFITQTMAFPEVREPVPDRAISLLTHFHDALFPLGAACWVALAEGFLAAAG